MSAVPVGMQRPQSIGDVAKREEIERVLSSMLYGLVRIHDLDIERQVGIPGHGVDDPLSFDMTLSLRVHQIWSRTALSSRFAKPTAIGEEPPLRVVGDQLGPPISARHPFSKLSLQRQVSSKRTS